MFQFTLHISSFLRHETLGLGRREWPARLYISRVHIQSMTGSQSTTPECGFRSEGLVPVNPANEDASGPLRVRTPLANKVATACEARNEIPKFVLWVVPAHPRTPHENGRLTRKEVCAQSRAWSQVDPAELIIARAPSECSINEYGTGFPCVFRGTNGREVLLSFACTAC